MGLTSFRNACVSKRIMSKKFITAILTAVLTASSFVYPAHAFDFATQDTTFKLASRTGQGAGCKFTAAQELHEYLQSQSGGTPVFTFLQDLNISNASELEVVAQDLKYRLFWLSMVDFEEENGRSVDSLDSRSKFVEFVNRTPKTSQRGFLFRVLNELALCNSASPDDFSELIVEDTDGRPLKKVVGSYC